MGAIAGFALTINRGIIIGMISDCWLLIVAVLLFLGSSFCPCHISTAIGSIDLALTSVLQDVSCRLSNGDCENPKGKLLVSLSAGVVPFLKVLAWRTSPALPARSSLLSAQLAWKTLTQAAVAAAISCRCKHHCPAV